MTLLLYYYWLETRHTRPTIRITLTQRYHIILLQRPNRIDIVLRPLLKNIRQLVHRCHYERCSRLKGWPIRHTRIHSRRHERTTLVWWNHLERRWLSSRVMAASKLTRTLVVSCMSFSWSPAMSEWTVGRNLCPRASEKFTYM